VSAWSTAHDRFDREAGFDTTVDWTLPDGEVVPRYYHIYSSAEFERDLAESDLDPVEVDISSGNCYAVVAPPDGEVDAASETARARLGDRSSNARLGDGSSNARLGDESSNARLGDESSNASAEE